MRLFRTSRGNTTDPFDDVSDWADTLRNTVVTELDPAIAAHTAQQAAMNSVGAAASIATVAGLSAGAATGGTTMTSATATYNAATSVFSSLGAKTAAWILAGVTVTGGLAATGNLPDAAQNTVAGLVERIGIELPSPALDGALDVSVGSAGTVSLEAVDGVLQVIDLEAVTGWDAAVDQSANGNLTVTFTGEGETLTMAAAIDASGQIRTEVTDQAVVPVPVAPQGDTRVDGSVDGSVDGTVSIDDGAIDLGSEIGLEGTLGLGN